MGTILSTPKGTNVKRLSRPWLRDLEWEFFYAWTTARGFSGFELDTIYSSDNRLLEEHDLEYYTRNAPHLLSSPTTLKTYIPPIENLKKQHPQSMGRPLYENPTYNLLMLGSRDTGKSYMVGEGVVLHQFLIDGATVYDEKTQKNPQKVELTVGAESSEKSNLMLEKIKLAMDSLPGSSIIGPNYYPSPLAKQYKGSWVVGKQITAEYSKKYQGGWKDVGSRSTIKHRSFKDDSFKDQGSRPLAIVLEEVGLFSNLKDVYANTKDNLRDGLRSIGSLVMLGTGGDMDKGTVDAYEMFYAPETYNILPFPNIWEPTNNIGFFIPAYMALNDYKDEYGFSLVDEAKKALMKNREKAKLSKGGSFALNKEMQYRPIVPSEMFLTRSSNIFPVPELRRRLSELDTIELFSTTVELLFDPSSPYNGVTYNLNEDLVPINQHPWPQDSPREGAVSIYEFPKFVDGIVPKDAYIIGCDPFKDDTVTGASFAAIYVMKTSRHPSTVGYDQIVASYIGRPYQGKSEVNETLHKLSLFYGNARIYFENAVGNVKDYFEKVRRLDLLALQPNTVFNRKASYSTPITPVYGYPMSNQKVKWEAIQYLRTWLLTERQEGVRNLDLIPDRYLLQQLVTFSMEGNFDAVMGVVGCVIGLEEMHNITKRKLLNEAAQTSLQQEWSRLIVNNKRLFNEQLPKTTSVLFSKE